MLQIYKLKTKSHKEAYLMGSCWNKEDISLNGSVAGWSAADEEEEAGDVTSSNESESNDEPLEIPDSEEEEEKKERTTGPLLLLSSPWTTLYFSCSIS